MEFIDKDVIHFIQCCPFCQKISEIKPHIEAQRFVISTLSPMERIAIDSIGELEADELGNKHIIVIIDTFTRFVEMYPVPTTDAKGALRALMAHSGRYGPPNEIVSDQGTQFVNEMISEYIKITHIKHQLTMAYSHEENGIVERVNKEIMRHLRAIIFDTNVKSLWYLYLPLVQRIINSVVHESIGVSPIKLLFGTAIDPNREWIKSLQKEVEADKLLTPEELAAKDSGNFRQWSLDMMKKQQYIINLAKQVQSEKNLKHLARNRPISADAPWVDTYPVNSYVLVTYEHKTKGPGQGNKLLTTLKGPMTVQSISGNKYEVFNIATGKTEFHHVSKLKEYKVDQLFESPDSVALKDKQAYWIESILAHRGPIHTKTKMEFLVHWAGYDSSEDTWEPYTNLKDTIALHTYLEKNGIGKLCPPKFRKEKTDVTKKRRLKK